MSHGGSEFEQVVELVFQNVQYLLTVALAPGDTLCVEAEHKTDGSRWRGDFTSRCESSSSSLNHQLVSFTVVVTITSLCKDWDDFEKKFPVTMCLLSMIFKRAVESATCDVQFLHRMYTELLDSLHK
jgi:hypothetical protein